MLDRLCCYLALAFRVWLWVTTGGRGMQPNDWRNE